ILEEYDSEYDMQYHAMDTDLNNIIQKYNDPRLIAKKMNREYDITDATDDYHTLNGRSYPYTLRESIIVAEPDKTIKIRMFNSSSEMMAVHTHGHKATITHYDGVEQNPSAQIMRDTYDIAPAQRNDLKISTVDDGLHSYGEGIWIFHDHMERGITTDGMNPGGNVSALVYKKYLNEVGMPKAIGESSKALFTKRYQQRKLPVWQDIEGWDLGEVDARDYTPPPAGTPLAVEARPKTFSVLAKEESQNKGNSGFTNFILGLLFGLAMYVLYLNREKVIAWVSQFKKGDK
ncbi:MAG: multicopper oxidase domain-containing protein, partial [Methylococcales bacterium]